MHTTHPHQPLSAKVVLRLYAAGERNFCGAMLPGEDFSNADLSGADFTGANIQGTWFVDATLRETNFSGVKAGVPRFWQIVQKVAIAVLSLPVGFMLARTGGSIGGLLDSHDIFSVNSGMASLIMAVVFGAMIVIHGLTWQTLRQIGQAATLVAIVAVTLHGLHASFFVLMLLPRRPIAAISELGITVLITVAAIAQGYGLVLLLAAITLTLSVTGTLMAVLVLAVALFCTAAFDHYAARDVSSLWALVFIAASLLFARYIYGRMRAGDSQFVLAQSVSRLPSILWGTNFSGADLSRANFSQALLPGVTFSDSRRRSTDLTHVRWSVEQLRQAYFGIHLPEDPHTPSP